MSEDIDALLVGQSLVPPPDFSVRLEALAHVIPQVQYQSRTLRPWQWICPAPAPALVHFCSAIRIRRLCRCRRAMTCLDLCRRSS